MAIITLICVIMSFLIIWGSANVDKNDIISLVNDIDSKIDTLSCSPSDPDNDAGDGLGPHPHPCDE